MTEQHAAPGTPSGTRRDRPGLLVAAVVAVALLGTAGGVGLALFLDGDARSGGAACADLTDDLDVSYTLIDDASLAGRALFTRVSVANEGDEEVVLELGGAASVDGSDSAGQSWDDDPAGHLEVAAGDDATADLGLESGRTLDLPDGSDVTDLRVVATASSRDGDVEGCRVMTDNRYDGTPGSMCLQSAEQDPGGFPGGTLSLATRQSRPDEVKAVQEQLNFVQDKCVVVDGDYGPQTADVVRAFQQGADLSADGKVDQTTWDALFGY